MKEKEQSIENKLLGAAGIATVGIGGMNIASALSEQSADRKAEDDMKAYLATFRCDYGQGRNILGGETNIQLPGASELIQYTTEYKQLALNLKSDKAALGMMPGIESETVFDSATTGLYDDVSIGTQKGAFTSLSRALQDAESADAAEWQAMKDATAKKLKTGVIVAGAGAVGTIAANLAINHGKGDKSASILEKYKTPVIDITLERIPCSKYPGTTGTGYVPNCECKDRNSYFSEQDRKCITCGANAHVENNSCKCNSGYHFQDSNNETSDCIADTVNTPCTGSHVAGGTYPDCTCDDNQNAQYADGQCTCKQSGFDYNSANKCVLSCNGLPKVKSNDKEVPNCECEYQYAVFDSNNPQNGCKCPDDKPVEDSEGKTCIAKVQASDDEPIVEFNLSGDEVHFESNSSTIANCNDIVAKISGQINNLNDQQKQAFDNAKCLKFESVGHTDTRFFSTHPRKPSQKQIATNKEKNQALSVKRAQALQNCLQNSLKMQGKETKFTHIGKGWDECEDATSTPPNYDKNNTNCRKAVVKIYKCDTGIAGNIKAVTTMLNM